MKPLPWAPKKYVGSPEHHIPESPSDVPPPVSRRQQVKADRGGTAAGRDIASSVLAPHGRVTNIGEQHIHHGPTPPVIWPLEIGAVPRRASAFQQRHKERAKIYRARLRGGGLGLTQVLTGGGGVGKSQLASALATEALENNFDLVVWVAAGDEQQLMIGYAQAAVRIGVPGAVGQEPEDDARAFLSWLATTSRQWLIVLDDITNPSAVEPWWPVSRTGTGWVLATTRLRDARLTGGGRTRIDIGVYALDEAIDYLRTRLTDDGMDHLLGACLQSVTEALGYLPLALGLAAAYMINDELPDCTYLDLFNNQRTNLNQILPESADADGYGREITTALLLSLEAAQKADGSGLVIPVIRLAALLDPAGHPQALWAAPSVIDHLTARSLPRSDTTPATRSPEQPHPVTAMEVHSTLRVLHRYALITCETRAEPRAVGIHALTARAVRESIPDSELPTLAAAIADALIEIWPDKDGECTDLAAVLRTNTDALTDHAWDCLWRPEPHEVLYRTGQSLIDGGLPASAVGHWERLAVTSQQLLGASDPLTVAAFFPLAIAYRQAGRVKEPIDLLKQLIDVFKRKFGSDDPVYLHARAELAMCYYEAGNLRTAVTHMERVVAASVRVQGSTQPKTIAFRASLAVLYDAVGRTAEATRCREEVLADSERTLDPEHPLVLGILAGRAASHQDAGRIDEAIRLKERIVDGLTRARSSQHPETLTAWANLAVAYKKAGRHREAVAIEERVLVEREQVLRHRHPHTILSRVNLSVSYENEGRTSEAHVLLIQALTESESTLGRAHPTTAFIRNEFLRRGKKPDGR